MDIQKIKAIILDMDGVIVDSEPLHFEAHKQSLKEVGFELELDEYLDFGVATGDKFMYDNMAKKYPDKEMDVAKIHARKKEIYKELVNNGNLKLRENMVELLPNLKNKYRLAIASSGEKEIVMFILEKFGIKNFFEVILTGGDITKPKPDPEVYLKAVKKLRLPKEECIAIEDSATGLTAAKNANLFCMAVPCKFTINQNFSDADRMANSIYELADILLIKK